MSVLLTTLAAGGGLLIGFLTRAPAWIIATGVVGLAALAAWLTSAVPAGEALALYLAFCAGLSGALCLAFARQMKETRAREAELQDNAPDDARQHGTAAMPDLCEGGGARQ